MIVRFSTGGRGRDPSTRGSALELSPDMGSLSTGSVNFPSIILENGPRRGRPGHARMKTFGVRPEIELFDLSHVPGAPQLIQAGVMDEAAICAGCNRCERIRCLPEEAPCST